MLPQNEGLTATEIGMMPDPILRAYRVFRIVAIDDGLATAEEQVDGTSVDTEENGALIISRYVSGGVFPVAMYAPGTWDRVEVDPPTVEQLQMYFRDREAVINEIKRVRGIQPSKTDINAAKNLLN